MDMRGECGGIASPGVKVLPFREVHTILSEFEPDSPPAKKAGLFIYR